MATFFLDFENGNDANDGTTFANRWKTFAAGATAARIAPGDTIRIMASEDPTDAGINATWTNNSPTVTLASALNALITNCDSAWTAAANVTADQNTLTYLTSPSSSRMAIAAGFTTGKVAHFQIGATDFSAYQGITFAIHVNATVADNVLQVVLCSDTAGNTPVDTFNITGLNVIGTWKRKWINKGSALGASIQSIALYAASDPGTVTVLLDNINTTKAPGADCLSLVTPIGKQNGAEGGWYPIRHINGTTVTLEVVGQSDQSPTSSAPGFYGTSETVALYINKPILVNQAGGTTFAQCQENGTSGNLITYSGGWDRTAMTSQSGHTYVSNGTFGVTFCVPAAFNRFDRLHPVHWGIGFSATGVTDSEWGDIRPVATDRVWTLSGYDRSLIESCLANGCNNVFFFGITSRVRIISLTVYNSSKSNAFLDAPINFGDSSSMVNDLRIESYVLKGCNSYGYSYTQGCSIRNLEIWSMDLQYCKGTSTYAAFVDLGMIDYRLGTINLSNNLQNFYFGGGYGRIFSLTCGAPTGATSVAMGNIFTNVMWGEHLVRSASITGAIADATTVGWPTNGWTHLGKYNGVAGDSRGWYDGGFAKMFAELGANRHTLSGVGWRIDITNASQVYTADFPVRYRLAQLALQSGVASQIKLFVKRSSTSLSARLKVFGGEVNGVATTVANAAAGAGVWEELVLTVTPSEVDRLDVWLELWGAVASLYYDDMVVV